MDSLIEFVKNCIDLPKSEEIKFLKLLSVKQVSKGDYFIQEGEIPKKFGYVHRGLFRYFYLKNKGNEVTKSFIEEGNFVSSYSAMITHKPSAMYIEALEDSIVYEIKYPEWVKLKEGDPCWNQLLIAMLEKAFTIKETRERELLLLSADERYLIFKNEFLNIEKRVKQHLVASYLGISPVSLSRLRKTSH